MLIFCILFHVEFSIERDHKLINRMFFIRFDLQTVDTYILKYDMHQRTKDPSLAHLSA